MGTTAVNCAPHSVTNRLQPAGCNKLLPPQNHLIPHKEQQAQTQITKGSRKWNERETDGADTALDVLKFPLLGVDLGEDRGVSGCAKPYLGLNIAPLCSRLHAGDRGLGSLGLSVVQCIRKAAVVLPGRQRRRRSLKQPKKKERFHGIFCLAAQTVVYDTPGTHKTSNSQTISHPRSLCHSNINPTGFQGGVEAVFKGGYMLLKSGKMGLRGNIIFKMDKKRTESDAGCNNNNNNNNNNKKTLKKGDMKMSKSENMEP